MPQVVLHQVERPALAGDMLAGFALDTPQPGQSFAGHALDVTGWVAVADPKTTVSRIEIEHGREVIRRDAADLPRLDLKDHYQARRGQVLKAVLRRFPAAAQLARQVLGRPAGAGEPAPHFDLKWHCSGFQLSVSTLGLPSEFELQVVAVVEGGPRVPLAILRGQRTTLQCQYQPRRQPVILTHLGRSGSTWMARLLSEHPDIVVHRRYPHEVNAAVHALRVLHVLATPANAVRHTDLVATNQSLDSVSTLPLRCGHDDPRLSTYLRLQQVQRQAEFCLQTIDGIYDVIAASQNKPTARYFSEKFFVFPIVAGLAGEIYSGAKELFLVRDFRDTLCSRQAFFPGRHGRQMTMSDNIRGAVRKVELLSECWRLRGHRAHLVRYEDLVLRPVETLTSVFRYLEIDASRSTIEALLQRASQESLDKHITAGDPIQSVGRWRRDLPEEVHDQVNRQFRDSLRLFGYEDADCLAEVA